MKNILIITGTLILASLVHAEDQKSPPMSQEEFNKTFNVVVPTQAQIDVLLKGGPDAVKTVDRLLQDTVRQTLTMSQVHFAGLMELQKKKNAELEQRINALESSTAASKSLEPLSPPTERLTYQEAKKRALRLRQAMDKSEVERLLGTPDSFRVVQMGGAPGVDRWQALVQEYIWKEGYTTFAKIVITYQKAPNTDDTWIINNFDVQ